jgi:putative membrane protein
MQIEFRSRPAKGLKGWITQWLVNAIALVLVARFVSGVQLNASGNQALLTVLGASAVLGLLNLLLKPFLLLITLPINVLSLGLFTLVINGGVLSLTSALVKGFEVQGFWPAVWGALLLSVINLVLSSLFGNFFFSLNVHKQDPKE